ncbi:MAG: hypothetical protein KBT45_01375 [Bacteroidales bacterium]|nr:hypothetical protein [Candidatus Colimorpha pelethequi]
MDFNAFKEKVGQVFNDTKEKVSEMVVQLRFKDLLKDLYRDNELTEKEKEFAITEAKRWGMSEAEARHIIENAEWDHAHKTESVATLEDGTSNESENESSEVSTPNEPENTKEPESSKEPSNFVKPNFYFDDYIYKFEFDGNTLYARLDEDAHILTSQVENFKNEEGYENTGKGITELCNDVDELAVAIAKQIIQSSSNIRYSVYDYDPFCNDNDPLFEGMELANDYRPAVSKDFVNLTLETNVQPFLRFEVAAIEDASDVDKIREYIHNRNFNGLKKYYDEHDFNTHDIFNLWGDDETEILGYSIEDNEGNTIDEGELVVREYNVWDYPLEHIYNGNDAPDHLLVHVDKIIKKWARFKIPNGANIQNIHFPLSIINPGHWIINDELVGDTITTIDEIHYAGINLERIDGGDEGMFGSNQYFLLKKEPPRWNIPVYRVIV